MTIRSGQLDRRITIEEPIDKTVDGIASVEYVEIDPPCRWAKQLSTSAASRVIGPERMTELTTVWSVRYHPGITTKCRLVYRGENYRIVSSVDGQGRREETIITTEKEAPERG